MIENLLGLRFVAVGGDAIEELQRYELCRPIIYSDGVVLLGGGGLISRVSPVYPILRLRI